MYRLIPREEAQKAQRDGADFILFGPVFFTPSKARYGAPQGLAALQKTLAKTSLPVYAIGGVKVENVARVRQANIQGIALISAVLSAADPKKEVKNLLALSQGVVARNLPRGIWLFAKQSTGVSGHCLCCRLGCDKDRCPRIGDRRLPFSLLSASLVYS